MSILEADTLRAQFFDLIFGENVGYVCICTRRGADDTTFKQHFYEWPKRKMDVNQFIEERKHKDNMWFCINLLSSNMRRAQFAKPHNLVWADLDEAEPDTIEPKPQIVIQSSPGRWQAIWRTDEELDPYLASEYSKRIAYANSHNGSDKSGWDLTQLLRVPFTYNHKYKESPRVELERAMTVKIPSQLFALLPDPPESPEDAALLATMPTEFPDADAVIYKYQGSLRMTAFQRLYTIEPPESEDWSGLLWNLLMLCFEAGMEQEEVFAVAEASSVNKYKRDGRSMRYLWRDVQKANLANKQLEAMIGDYAGLTMPELLTDAEVELLENSPQTIVDEYREWASAATDAVKDYHDLCCMMILSSLLAPGVKLETTYGRTIPNLWGLILGESTLTRKTTATDMAIDFITDIDRDMVLATDGSAEGILTGLATRPKITSIFYRDEVGGLFESMQKKEYMAGLPEMFTKLYDSNSIVTRRLRKEVISVNNPIFLFFGGGIRDKMFSLINEEYITSGFMPRFLIVSGEADLGALRATGPAMQRNTDKRDEFLARFRHLHHMYVAETDVVILGQTTKMQKMNECFLTTEAWDRYQQIETQMVHAANESPRSNVALPTFERLSRSLLKMAILFAATRQEPVEGTIQADVIDILQAASYIQKWGRFSVDMVNNSGRNNLQRTIDKIYVAVKRKPGITRGQIMQNYHLTKAEMDVIQGTLMDRGQLIAKSIGRGYEFTAV